MSPWGWHFLCLSSKVRAHRGQLKAQSQFDESTLSRHLHLYIWRSHCLKPVVVKISSQSLCLFCFNSTISSLCIFPSSPFFPVSSLPTQLFTSTPDSYRMTTVSCPCSVRTLWWVCWTFVETQRKWRPYWMAMWTNVLQAPTTDPASAVLNWPSSTKSRRYESTILWI